VLDTCVDAWYYIYVVERTDRPKNREGEKLMRIEMTADDGRVLMFEDAGPEKFQLTILKKVMQKDLYAHPDTKKENTLLNGLMLKKEDVKRLAKAS